MSPRFYVHPQAECNSLTVGERTEIRAFTFVGAGAILGPDCSIGSHVTIGPAVELGARVMVQPGARLAGQLTCASAVFIGPNVVFVDHLRPRAHLPAGPGTAPPTVVGKGSTIGAGAVILCGLTIGPYAFIGAGAVVTHDVPAFTLVVGNPAREVGMVCACGLPYEGDPACVGCTDRPRPGETLS